MAEENVTPIEPPKVNPLAKPAVPHGTTIRLKPVIRNGTQTTLRTGLKLPPRPGAAAVPVAAPAAPAAAPAASPSSTAAIEQLKGMTNSLKSITAPIPQRAILHKTGIIADPGMTAAQIAAAKARTSRISLSDAMGAAPVRNENAPMKTIRIKRPVDIPGTTTNFPHPQELVPGEQAAPAPAPSAPAAAAASAPADPTAASTSVTQRKTIKVMRPGAATRPAGKFGIKKPGATQAPTVVRPKGAEGAAPAESAKDAVADIPDLPAAPGLVPPAPAASAAVEADVPKTVAILGIIVQLAASVAMGLLAYKLYVDTTISTF